jgi:hypothetical protein
MKKAKLCIVPILTLLFLIILPALCFAQGNWQKELAGRFAGAVAELQQYCIEKAEIECEMIEVSENPPLLGEGQTVDYIGVRKKGVPYFYIVAAEREDMRPNIFLLDSRGKLLINGKAAGPFSLAVHAPEYTQKVTERIKMSKGSGRIAVGILVPVGSY